MLKTNVWLKLLITLLFFLPTIGQADTMLSAINFTSQSSDKLQVQMDLSGAAVAPKVFKTDNPARIVLDFAAVKNGLTKKIYPINQGPALNAYVIEADGRVRVILNLLEAMPFDVKTEGNKVILTLTPTTQGMTVATANKPIAKSLDAKLSTPEITKATNAKVAAFIPEQTISGFDFKRGDKSEGRILVSLANPNTVVNSKKDNGKVVIHFLNTQLPDGLAKRMDVSEFATPVKFNEYQQRYD
jgi:type IV pilus assembly protein PilQ